MRRFNPYVAVMVCLALSLGLTLSAQQTGARTPRPGID
jgi:hypothetical protein